MPLDSSATRPPLTTGQDSDAATAGIGAGLRLAAAGPRLRLMLVLLTADAIVVGTRRPDADYSGWPNSTCVSWLFFPQGLE